MEAAPDVVEHADSGWVGSSARGPASRGGPRPAREPGAARNGAIQMPGVHPAAAMADADAVDARRELVVRRQPVADRGLEAVVELEHVERPVGGEGQVGVMSVLGDPVEVVVPGAPAHLVRRVVRACSAAPTSAAQRASSADGRRRRARRRGAGVRRAPGARTAPPRVASARTSMPVAAAAEAERAVVLAAADEADAGSACRRGRAAR